MHDPKIANEVAVKGQVRLQFQDVTGKLATVQRTVEATQKAKQLTCRQMEGLISRIGPDGSKQSLSTKCAEIDREMTSSLGVSQPVLENVIFCHQEDSSWPLTEGKVLKQKFDDIFASTRYVKALECIRKTRQEQVSRLKEYQAEIRYLRANKEKEQELQEKLSEAEGKLLATEDSIQKIKDKLKPISDQLDQIQTKSNEIFMIQTKIEKLLSEKKQMEKYASELREGIENEFEGSIDELTTILEEFGSKIHQRQDQLDQCESEKQNVSRELDRRKKEESKLLVELGGLEKEAERNSQTIVERDALIKKYSDQLGFEGASGSVTLEEFREFIKSRETEWLEEAKRIKASYEEKEEVAQKKLDEIRDTKTKLEQSERMKTEQMTKNKAEIRSISQELSRVDASAGKLESLERDLKRKEHDLSEAEGSVDIDALKADVIKLQKEKTELDKKMRELSSEMDRMHLQSTTQTQLDMMKKEKVKGGSD